MAATHYFVDESKAGSYLLVAVEVPSDVQPAIRKELRSLVLPGQRRLHMTKERDSRRRAIIAAIQAAGVKAVVYDAGRSLRDLAARAVCLAALVADVAESGGRIVLERDESLGTWDDQRLIEITRNLEAGLVRYEHRSPTEELLLGLPDAIAWCWAKGGDWRRQVAPFTVTCAV